MSAIVTIYVVEFQQERRAVTRAFTAKAAALAWARERVQDETIAGAAVWQLTSSLPPREALAIAAEGKQWYDARECIAMCVRPTVRVRR